MKNISDVYVNNASVEERINESMLNEGLKDYLSKALAAAKEKLSQAADAIIQAAKGVYAKFKYYIIPIDDEGQLLPTVGGYTCGAAYKDGQIAP